MKKKAKGVKACVFCNQPFDGGKLTAPHRCGGRGTRRAGRGLLGLVGRVRRSELRQPSAHHGLRQEASGRGDGLVKHVRPQLADGRGTRDTTAMKNGVERGRVAEDAPAQASWWTIP